MKKDRYINIKGYNLATHYIRENVSCGGVAIYIDNKIDFKELTILREYSIDMECEFCGIYISELNLVVITLYRSPSAPIANFLTNLNSILNIVAKKDYHIVLAGDFNINFLSNTSQHTDIHNLLLSYNIHITNYTPTRITAHSNTCLDNICTNYETQKYSVQVINPHLSDHSGLHMSIQENTFVNKQNDTTGPDYIFNDSNIEFFYNKLANIDWDKIYNCKNNLHSYGNFHTKFYKEFKNCFTNKRTKNNRKNKHKLKIKSPELTQIKNTLNLLYDSMRCHNKPEIERLYKKYKIYYRRKISTMKINQNSDLIKNSKNKNQTMWKIINKERKENHKKTCTIDANVLNDFFLKTPVDLMKQLPKCSTDSATLMQTSNSRNPNTLFLYATDKYEVGDIIKNLKNTQSSDIYGFNIKVLKSVYNIISEPLAQIFNQCMTEGIFPLELKLAKIIPVHKKGSLEEPGNFRPISLLPTVSKVFEHIIKNRIVHFLNKNNIISSTQFGFIRNRSTIDALIKTVEYIYNNLNEGHIVALLLCDLKKAFDCMNYKILIQKLEYIGIRGVALKLLESYLTDRHQVVYSNGKYSNVEDVLQGVPQGSVLGPLLFILYINDLPINILEDSVNFADDVNFMCKSKQLATLNQKLESCLKAAIEWFSVNKLVLSTEKTKILTITTKRLDIEQENNVKFLGIIIDNKMSWKQHINELSGRLSKSIFMLRKIVNIVDVNVARIAYFAIFHSYINYGIVLWGLSTDTNRIFILQKRAIRLLAKVKMGTHCRPLFQKLKILTLPCLLIHNILLYTKKNIQNFCTHTDIHWHDTRNKNEILVPKVRLNIEKQNPFYYGPVLYNKLPAKIKDMNYKHFKQTTMNMLASHSFYNIEEYLSANLDLSIL